MASKRCFFKQCPSNSLPDNSTTFHNIPPDRSLIYLHQSGWFMETNLDIFVNQGYRNSKICSLHFQKTDFTYIVRTGYKLCKQLRVGATPMHFRRAVHMSDDMTQTESIKPSQSYEPTVHLSDGVTQTEECIKSSQCTNTEPPAMRTLSDQTTQTDLKVTSSSMPKY